MSTIHKGEASVALAHAREALHFLKRLRAASTEPRTLARRDFDAEVLQCAADTVSALEVLVDSLPLNPDPSLIP